MKLKTGFILLSIILSTQVFAGKSQTILYANIYADQMLDVFDKELSQKYIFQNKFSMMDSDSYISLLASREYIEKLKFYVSLLTLISLNSNKFLIFLVLI